MSRVVRFSDDYPPYKETVVRLLQEALLLVSLGEWGIRGMPGWKGGICDQ